MQSTPNTPHINATALTALLGLLTSFAPFSIDMYLAAFPAIAQDLHTSVDKVQLSLSVFFAGLALGQLFYGPLIDRFGRRLPLLCGLVLYTISSAGIAFAPNIEVFIMLRFAQALGGCSGMIISRAIIQDLFEVNSAARVLSLMMVMQSIGPIAAPVLGGYLLSISGWPIVFNGMCLLGLGSFIAAFIFLPETLPAEKRVKQSIMGILAVFYRLLRNPGFTFTTLAGGFTGACMFAFISGSPFVFMNLHGLSETSYGWSFACIAMGMGLASQINRMLLKKYKAHTLMLAAIFLNATFAALLLTFAGTEKFWLLYALIFITIAFMPMAIANATAIAMACSLQNAGSASALLGVLQFTLAGIISALSGALHNGTAYPMAGLILLCGVLSIFVLVLQKVFIRKN